MATNHYFNNFSPAVTNEMLLLEDLINENVRMMGHDIYYILRDSHDSADKIIGEIVRSKFERSFRMEMYIQSVEKFEGDGDFFSKFGLEIRDNSTFLVPKRTFEKNVPSVVALRPREGDILYVPLMKRFFEIKFIEEEANFFSKGKRKPYYYELKCEMLRYNQEQIITGNSELDDYEAEISYTIQLVLAGAASNSYNIGETVYQGSSLATANAYASVTDWDRANNYLYVNNVVGEFTGNVTVIGYSTNTRYTLSATDLVGDFITDDTFENRDIQGEANTLVIFESNPLGAP